MSVRERLTLAAAFAVALGSASLVPLYADLGWLLPVLGAIAAVAGAGLVGRRTRLPGPLQPLLTSAALALYTCAVFAGGTLTLGLLPHRRSITLLTDLVQAGLADVEQLAPPVPARTGLTLLAVLGVGAVAVLVDLVAVVLRRPAAAGLPLLALFAVPAAILPGGLGWLPFTVGAIGWLTLLLVEGNDRVSQWGAPLAAARPGRRAGYDDASLGRVGRRIGAAALGLAVVVPALVPGLNARLVGGSGDGPGAGSRTATTYNPITRLRGELTLPKPRDILTYDTTASQPDYLRLTTLDLFTDAGWSSSKLIADPSRDGVKDALPPPVGLAASARTETVTVRARIRTLVAQWLPVPIVPSRVKVDGRWLYDERSETVFSTRTGTSSLNKSYSVTAVRAVPDQAALAAGADTELPPDVLPYAVDPGLQVTPAVRQLTERIIAGRSTPYAKVEAIQAFFTSPGSGFTYSTSPQVPGIVSPSALADFLQARQGFCEQYASAMGAMIRIAGVPARVAVGFTPGRQQPDGSYRVTTSDAHAWPEAWFAGSGWLRFEPTPRRDQVVVPGYAQSAAGGPNGSAGGPGATPRLRPGPDATSRAASPLQGKLDRIEGAGGTPSPAPAPSRRARAGQLAWVALAGLALLVLLPRLGHLLRRRRRWRTAGAAAGWQQVRDDAVDLGHVWRPADSPRAAARQLGRLRDLDRATQAALDRLAVAAERERYARTASAENGSQHQDAALVRAALRAATGRGRRWRAWLLPTSTLRWASAGLGTFVADALDRFDAVWAAAAGRLRPGGTRPA